MTAPSHPPTRVEDGFTLVELAVVMLLLSVVGAMALTMLLTTQRVSREITGRSDVSSDLRLLLDDTFADLATARGPLRCASPEDATTFATCRQITESGSPLIEASTTKVCFHSRRPQPATDADAASLTATPWKVCVRRQSDTIVIERYQPIGEISPTYSSTPTSTRAVGSSSTTNPFSFIDASGATMATGTLTANLPRVAIVEMAAELTFRDKDGKSRARTLAVSAGLRASRYLWEGTWTGDDGLTGAP